MNKTDTEMVWRVARALATAWAKRPDIDVREIFDVLARASIEAMREPTEAMRKEGMRCMLGNLRPDEAYKHMIDAALGRQFPPFTASDPSQGSDTTETKNAAPEPILGRPGASDGEGTP